jgi:hypothetical protein
MSSCARVVVMECCNLQPGMDLLMYLPAVITCVIAFPLDQILKLVIPHVTVKLLNLILVFAIDNSQGWRRGMSMTWNGVREC